MKLLASATLAIVAARSRVVEDSLRLDSYGNIHSEKIHLEQLLQSWNNTMGTAPPRGWYRMRMEAVEGIDPNQIIKKSGLEGKTSVSFEFNLPKEHYCQFRAEEQCCDREDQNCYTVAGCFCDEACFTTYGDCCQDHFVSCYDKLGLCLEDVDEKPEAKSATSNGYKEINAQAKRDRQNKQILNDATKFSKPSYLEPNACCGQHKYNNGEDCCVTEGGYKFVRPGECAEEAEEDIRTSNVETDSAEFESPEVISSPDFSFDGF